MLRLVQYGRERERETPLGASFYSLPVAPPTRKPFQARYPAAAGEGRHTPPLKIVVLPAGDLMQASGTSPPDFGTAILREQKTGTGWKRHCRK